MSPGNELGGERVADLAGTGSAVQADVSELPGLIDGLPRPLLVAFPFNVLGILPDPRAARTGAA